MSDGAAVDLVRLSETIIQAGSKSFAAAARLFDRETRASAYLLYAWCRHCDDAIDGQELGFQSASATPHDPKHQLAELQRLTADALDGKPMADPVFAAFQRVAEKHAIPRRHPFALLDGFAMDAMGRQYETIDDTLSYCYHVAGVVGVMMALVMGVRDDDILDRASDLGLAFQLTNIARDVVDDAKVGRVYLPRQWLAEAGIAPETLRDPRHRPALAEVTARLLALADTYYVSSQAGIAHLPLRSRWAIATALRVYREIGREVRRRGAHAWDARVSTSKAQKLVAVTLGGATALSAPLRERLSPSPPRGGLWTRPKSD
jgi:15-cis-phytoene synthase